MGGPDPLGAQPMLPLLARGTLAGWAPPNARQRVSTAVRNS